jgi:hypothetical protein
MVLEGMRDMTFPVHKLLYAEAGKRNHSLTSTCFKLHHTLSKHAHTPPLLTSFRKPPPFFIYNPSYKFEFVFLCVCSKPLNVKYRYTYTHSKCIHPLSPPLPLHSYLLYIICMPCSTLVLSCFTFSPVFFWFFFGFCLVLFALLFYYYYY